MLFLVSRRQSSCRDITLCCCRLHWLLMISRLQIFFRDITSLISAPSSTAYNHDSCHDLQQIPSNLPDVVTSELDCVDLKTASMSQLVASISASTIDCIFIHLLLHFSSFFHFPANDKLVSFFIFLFIIYSILDEKSNRKMD